MSSIDPIARRSTAAIFSGVAAGTTALFAAFTLAPLAAVEFTGERVWAGIPGAFGIVGTAVGAGVLSRMMARRGRRAGLTLGWSVGVAGAVLGVAAVEVAAIVPLIAAMMLLGVGHAASQLARFAAADFHPPERRGKVLGWIVWAGTIGALVGPNLLSAGRAGAEAVGLAALSGGFIVALAFYGASVVTTWGVRPGISESAAELAAEGEALSLAELRRQPHIRLAIAALIAAQAAMVLVMTITPVHMSHAGHGLAAIGLVMSAHFVGMYALAPLAGTLSSRIGPPAVIGGGLSIVALAALGAALSPPRMGIGLGLALFGIGIGWSFSFVAGSSLLTSGLAYAQRVRVQGNVDVLAWSSSAIASFSSGLLLSWIGFAALSVVGAAVVVPVVILAARRPTPAPAAAPTVTE